MIREDVEKIKGGHYDLIIVGGGINGAGLANMASSNGFKAVLLEKGAIASGTSSKSSKLLHGGLRYLEHLELDLVRESLRERAVQLKGAGSLTKPLGFIIPFYKKSARPSWMWKAGVKLYDFLSGKYLIYPHRQLKPDEVSHFSPLLNREGLKGGVLYYDAQMDDKALCIANAKSAEHAGAIVVEQARVKEFIKENGKAVGVRFLDEQAKQDYDVFAKRIVVTTGPWTDQLMVKDNKDAPKKVRPTKGVHIVYDQKICDHALLLQTENDKRIFFVMPYHGKTLIGTTDTDYLGDPDKVEVTQEDVQYLFNEMARFFPGIKWSEDRIVETFAGLRPLVSRKGSASKISRNHVIEKSYSGVTYVMGGKYTTYRKIAEDVLKFIFPKELKQKEIIEWSLHDEKKIF